MNHAKSSPSPSHKDSLAIILGRRPAHALEKRATGSHWRRLSKRPPSTPAARAADLAPKPLCCWCQTSTDFRTARKFWHRRLVHFARESRCRRLFIRLCDPRHHSFVQGFPILLILNFERVVAISRAQIDERWCFL